MAHALNLVIPIAQDESTQARLRILKSTFSSTLQPIMDKVFRDSKIIHFARIFTIEDKYFVFVAEHDGSGQEYGEFFRRALDSVFGDLFSFAGVGQETVLDERVFYDLVRSFSPRSLGDAVDGSTNLDGSPDGYLFSAYQGLGVVDILSKLD